MKALSEFLHISPEVLVKIITSVSIVAGLILIRLLANHVVRKKVADIKQAYHIRRFVGYTFAIVLALIVGFIWIEGFDSLSTFLGLTSAGLAIAMHDTIANMAGWFFILILKPFKVGDRIQIGTMAGDVIDIRLFQFSMVEIGNWVDGDQSTGRIVHVPNSKVLRDPLANYHVGFEYIWNEIPVLVTFESNWKKAKEILAKIASEKADHLSAGAQKQIRRAAEKFMIFYGKLTPIVYTTVKDSGVMLTIRYMVDPRHRRSTQQDMWEAILDAFSVEPDIDLAYPTTRFFNRETKPDKN